MAPGRLGGAGLAPTPPPTGFHSVGPDPGATAGYVSELTASANNTCLYEDGSESLHTGHLEKLSVQTPQVSREMGGLAAVREPAQRLPGRAGPGRVGEDR